MTSYAVVIPTLVPDTLADCLAALAAATGPRPAEIVLVDDRTDPEPGPLRHPLSVLGDLRERTTVLGGGGRGPAAVRTTGLTHAVITTAGIAACALAATGHGRAETACALGWAAGTAEFARARIAPGPRTRHEVTTTLASRALIPPTATWHRPAGARRHRHTPVWQEEATP